ncbi:hypothetical protein ACRCOZ_17960 [Pseudomonas aeruginosa]
MARLPHHKLLHRDGLWRILDLKYLERRDPNPQTDAVQSDDSKEDLWIQVTIGRIVQLGERTEIEDTENVSVPIGDIPLMLRNRLIRDGQLLPEQYELDEESEVGITLDLSPENLRLFKRFDTENSETIFKSTKFSSAEDEDLLFVGIGHNGDPYGIIVSCTDIFSFFYANSTFLTQLVLSESILSPESIIYDRDKSITSGRYRKIWLKDGIPAKDARYLAMLLFDDYALESAKSIFLHRGPDGRKAKKWAIRAIPPIKGKVKLKLKGRYYGSRLIVTEIVRCGWIPPFDHLEWERDKRSSKTTYKAVEPECTRKLVDVEAPKTITDGPGDRRTVPSEVKQAHLGQRFPLLKTVSLKRSPQPKSEDKEGGRYARENVPTEEASTAQGGSGQSKRRADAREAEESPPETSESHRELENVQLSAKDVHDQCVLSSLILLAAHKAKLASVNFINPGLASTILVCGDDRVPLCLLPREVDGKEKAWLFSDKLKLRQRAALIARVEFRGEIRFVFELQMRMDQYISTALVWGEPHSEDVNSLLKDLLLLIAGSTSSTERTLTTKSHGLFWGPCRHKTLTGTMVERAEEFLVRLFDTPAFQEQDERK